jgi:hypothetical protein
MLEHGAGRGALVAALALLHCGTAVHQARAVPGSPIRLGSHFAQLEVTPISTLTADPARFAQRVVRTRGRIQSVCREGGCWIDLWPLSGSGTGILVMARGQAFTFPRDSEGRVAEVEGRYYVETCPEKRVKHWSHHGWRPGTPVQGPLAVQRLEAVAVRVE